MMLGERKQMRNRNSIMIRSIIVNYIINIFSNYKI
nr:MAG TPA: hypothetical protein [Crassvirales sp.]